MRERLKAFLKSAEKSANALEMEGLAVAASYLLGCVQTVQHILDTEQPDGSVKPQWVPVSERLPEYGQRVFVINRLSDGEEEMMLASSYRYDDGKQWFMDVQTGFQFEGVTHWHAIDYPQPPEVNP